MNLSFMGDLGLYFEPLFVAFAGGLVNMLWDGGVLLVGGGYFG